MEAVLVRFVIIGLGNCKVEFVLPLLLLRQIGGLPIFNFSGVVCASDIFVGFMFDKFSYKFIKLIGFILANKDKFTEELFIN